MASAVEVILCPKDSAAIIIAQLTYSRVYRKMSHGIVLVAVLALLACDSSTQATGQVRDTRGRPVAGVVVRLESGAVSARTMTNGAGRYSVRQTHGKAKAPADLTFCKAGYYLARRWFDDSRSVPSVLDVIIREIDTTASPARIAGARAPCAALGVGASEAKPNAR
jgi:hypothetical protein